MTKKYKSLRPQSTTKFIAFSGHTDKDIKQACKDAGMIPPHILHKPMDREAVSVVLKSVFGSH